jgi:hypothetical protein
MPIFESVSDIESLDFDYVIVGGQFVPDPWSTISR